MDGLIEESKELMEEVEEDEVLEFGMLAAAQAVEDYEMPRGFGVDLSLSRNHSVGLPFALVPPTLRSWSKP